MSGESTVAERRRARMAARMQTRPEASANGEPITLRRDQICSWDMVKIRLEMQDPDTPEPLRAPDEAMEQMIVSIAAARRIDSPIFVWRPAGEQGAYRLVSGYRRLTAIRHVEERHPELAPLAIAAIDYSHLCETEVLALAFRENEQRAAMLPAHRAIMVGKMRNANGQPLTYESLAGRLGLSRSSAQKILWLAERLERRPWVRAHIESRPHVEKALRALLSHDAFTEDHAEAEAAECLLLERMPNEALTSEKTMQGWLAQLSGAPDKTSAATAQEFLKAHGFLWQADGSLRLHHAAVTPPPSAGSEAIEPHVRRAHQILKELKKLHRIALKNERRAQSMRDG